MKKPPKKPPSKPVMPQTAIKMAFAQNLLTLRIDTLVPTKTLPPALRQTGNFKRILASIQEIGMIEPLAVAPDGKEAKHYILLDGHLRFEALKDLGRDEALCLISTDDEAFTYNKHISRITSIQEHKMIVKAIERGVSEEKIAKALNVNVNSIVRKRTLLDGICNEAADLLKDKMVTASVFAILKQMKDIRQIEAAQMMNDFNMYSINYVRGLLVSTPSDQLVNPAKSKKVKGLNPEQIMHMENERDNLQRAYSLIEENFAPDMYNLTLAQSWLGKLIKNPRIEKYLAQNHADVLAQFQKISGMKSLNVKEA